MSPVKVHGMNLSAPCRLVYLTCEAVGIEYEKVDVDLMNGGTRTPEFLKVCYYFWFYRSNLQILFMVKDFTTTFLYSGIYIYPKKEKNSYCEKVLVDLMIQFVW